MPKGSDHGTPLLGQTSAITSSLEAILVRTAADARRSSPEWRTPARKIGGILTIPAAEKNFCSCVGHPITADVFGLPAGYKKLPHFASAWLSVSRAEIEATYASSGDDAILAAARHFFEGDKDRVFRRWLERALGASRKLAERKIFAQNYMSSGSPPQALALYRWCGEIATRLGDAFRRELEAKLPMKKATKRHEEVQGDTADAETESTRSAELAPGAVPQTAGAGQAKPTPNQDSSLARSVARKLKDPDGNPVMKVAEVAFAFSKSHSTIYRWLIEGTLNWAPRVKGRILTKDVKKLLEPSDK